MKRNEGLSLWGRLDLRARLLLLLMPVLLMTGIIAYTIQFQHQADAYQVDIVHEMNRTMDLLEMSLTEHVIHGDAVSIGRIINAQALKMPLLAAIRWQDRSGKVVEMREPAPELIAPAWFRHRFAIHEQGQSKFLAVEGVNYGQIRVELSSAHLENNLWREARTELWIYGLELMLLGLILSAFLTRWLRPLETIAAAGRHFMEGDLSTRVVNLSRFAPEVRDMGGVLNQVMAYSEGLMLALSEQRRAINNGVIVVESDTKGIIANVNDKFCEVSGYSRDEVIGRDHRFLYSGHHPRAFFQDLWATLESGETWHGEICNRSKKGTMFWLLTTITPVLGADGKPARFISVRVDITQRKLAEQSLFESEERFRGTFEQAAVGMAHISPDGRFMRVNQKLCEIVGYSQEELMSRTFQDITYAEDLEADLDNVALVLSGEIQTYQMEKRYINKQGALVWINLTVSLIREPSGEPRNFIAVIEDISRRKVVEGALAQQSQIIDQTLDAIFSTDLDGTLVSWNRGAGKLFGYSAHEAIGQPVRFLAPPGAEAGFYTSVFLVLLRAGSGVREVELQKKSGQIFTAYFSLTLLKDEAGQEIGVAGYVLDITERKAIESALRASEKKYRDLVESMQDWVWEVNEHGAYTYSSPRVREMLGYAPEEVLGKTPFDLMPPEEAKKMGTAFSAIIAARGPIRLLENVNLQRDGTPVVLETSGNPVFDEQGNFRGYQGIDRDITERKQIENALREREASLAFAQRVAHLGSWEWNLASGVVRWSDEVYRIWGFSPGAFTPSYASFIESIHPDDRELVEKFVAAALQNEVLYSIDHRIVLPDGRVRYVHEEAQVFRTEAGEVSCVAGTVQDISERKQIEEEIRESREQLRELSNYLQTVREEEKASISREIHDELGGNLTALKMDIFWLERKLPPEMKEAIGRVASMSDVVDASVHAMRRIVTELRPTLLDDLGLLAAMQWQASEFSKRYNIQCKVSMHGEEIKLTEEMRIALFRIFQEALTNVARYSKASRVLVDMWREHDKIALEVFDNGIGIPEGAIIQPTSHGIRGMMERARSLGGSVEIGSAPGEGVAISVRIPVLFTEETET